MAKAIPPRSEDYSPCYHEFVKEAGLAENSSLRGSMVIKPNGFSIWKKMQQTLGQKASIRHIPLTSAEEKGKCIFTGKASKDQELSEKVY